MKNPLRESHGWLSSCQWCGKLVQGCCVKHGVAPRRPERMTFDSFLHRDYDDFRSVYLKAAGSLKKLGHVPKPWWMPHGLKGHAYTRIGEAEFVNPAPGFWSRLWATLRGQT